VICCGLELNKQQMKGMETAGMLLRRLFQDKEQCVEVMKDF